MVSATEKIELDEDERLIDYHGNTSSKYSSKYYEYSANRDMADYPDESTEMLNPKTPYVVHTKQSYEYISIDESVKGKKKNKRKKRSTGFLNFIKLLSMKKKKNDDTPRLIYINNSELNEQQKFITNAISTGKYNAFSFLPKFLYEEFRKAANLFFLFISCIQVGYQKE